MLFAKRIGRDCIVESGLARPNPQAVGRRTVLTVGVLSITQIVGWGSLLFMPAVLVRFIQRDLGMSPEMAFGGVALMYLVGALAAPIAGTLMDRWGARFVMAGGSLAGAIGLTWLAHTHGAVSYLAAWGILGVTCASALTNAACVAITQTAGSTTLRGITALMFVTGLAGTLSLPTVHTLTAHSAGVAPVFCSRLSISQSACLSISWCRHEALLSTQTIRSSPAPQTVGRGRANMRLSPCYQSRSV